MANYSTEYLSDKIMSSYAETECVGYGAGESHRRIIEGSGGELGYDGFKNPLPNQSGNIYADRFFINQSNNDIQGINFNDSKGQFVCSYTGMDYQDIKDSNRQDIQNKIVREQRILEQNKQGDSSFFESIDKPSGETASQADEKFFKSQERMQAEGSMKEDKTFFEKVEDKVNKFGEDMDKKLEESMQKSAEVTQGVSGIKR